MGRLKQHDEEALYLMRRLVEEKGSSIRAAARQVAAERGYPDHKIKTFEEWARKEYAARRNAGTLPVGRPLSNAVSRDIQQLFQDRRKTAAQARIDLQEATEQAKRLDIDLSNPINRLVLMRAEKNDLETLLESDAHMMVVMLVQEGALPASPTEGEAAAAIQAEAERLDRITREMEILNKYIRASNRVRDDASEG